MLQIANTIWTREPGALASDYLGVRGAAEIPPAGALRFNLRVMALQLRQNLPKTGSSLSIND